MGWVCIILIGVCFEGVCVFGGLVYVLIYLYCYFGIFLMLVGGLMVMFGFGGFLYVLFVKCFVGMFGECGLVIVGGFLFGSVYLIFIFVLYWLWVVLGVFCVGIGYYMLYNIF